jgi:very-short-patch-repair endonuclease
MRNKLGKENFVELSKLIHNNNKFNYSLVDYINNYTKISIVCHLHGEFKQTPKNHLNGSGCPSCAIKYKSNRLRNSKEIFIEKSKLIHGDTYDYSLVEYINNKTNVIIICEKHGNFEQVPSHHYNGSGCPICKESKGERTIRDFLIHHNIKFIHQYTFIDCVDKARLPFDFYLPEHNICIEFDGIQHFKAKTLFGGEVGLVDRQKKDKIKTDYCNKNGINLLRIRYNENINKKLWQLVLIQSVNTLGLP